MTTIYLAGPLFSIAEREFNERLAEALRRLLPDLETILPQERAKDLLARPDGKELVFHDCLQMIEHADVVVAVLEGSDVDSGTAIELGYAYAKGIPIVGVRTDFRGSEDRGMNLMVSHVCTELVIEMEQSTEQIARQLARIIPTLARQSRLRAP